MDHIDLRIHALSLIWCPGQGSNLHDGITRRGILSPRPPGARCAYYTLAIGEQQPAILRFVVPIVPKLCHEGLVHGRDADNQVAG